jgi:DNA-binding NarL/FixJ family response regulator
MAAVDQQMITDNCGGPHRRPLRVLLIEYSQLIRRSVVEAIDVAGNFQVTAWADTPEVAIGLLGSEVFDAVIVDSQLKGSTGVDVLAYLQRPA